MIVHEQSGLFIAKLSGNAIIRIITVCLGRFLVCLGLTQLHINISSNRRGRSYEKEVSSNHISSNYSNEHDDRMWVTEDRRLYNRYFTVRRAWFSGQLQGRFPCRPGRGRNQGRRESDSNV